MNIPGRGNFIFKDLEVGRSTSEEIFKIYILFSGRKKSKGKGVMQQGQTDREGSSVASLVIILAFNKCSLSISSMPVTVRGIDDVLLNKSESPITWSCHSLMSC